MLVEQSVRCTPENGPRPAGPCDRCFYCGAEVGANHEPDCVARVKVVMVKIALTIPHVVPAHWDEARVNFHLNGSGWCANNIADCLDRCIVPAQEASPCLCDRFSGRYLRDAKASDVEGLDLAILAGLTPATGEGAQ